MFYYCFPKILLTRVHFRTISFLILLSSIKRFLWLFGTFPRPSTSSSSSICRCLLPLSFSSLVGDEKSYLTKFQSFPPTKDTQACEKRALFSDQQTCEMSLVGLREWETEREQRGPGILPMFLRSFPFGTLEKCWSCQEMFLWSSNWGQMGRKRERESSHFTLLLHLLWWSVHFTRTVSSST